MSEARETTQWTEQEFCRNRFYNFLGSDIPCTIACKELIDNMTDQIIDSKTPYGYFEIEPNLHSVTALDGGKGISLKKVERKDTGKLSTYLFLAVAKLYNSTNYDEEKTNSNITGLNGVGSKLSNFLSHNFTAGIVAQNPKKHESNFVKNDVFLSEIYTGEPETKVKGYHFQNGEATIDGVTPMNEAEPQWVNVNVPHFYGREDTFGYLVHADYDDSILGDTIDVNWIKEYLKVKVGQAVPKKEDILVTFVYPENGKQKTVVYARPADIKSFSAEHKKEIANGDIEILYSWDENVASLIAANKDEVWGPITSGYYTVVFAKNPDLLKEISNMAQGAPVENNKSISYSFVIGQNKISVPVYCAFCLRSPVSRGIGYSDQTKRMIKTNNKTPAKLQLTNLTAAFERCFDAKSHFESVANEKALGSSKRIRSDAYWEATGGKTARDYFSYGVKTNADAKKILDRIKFDPDVIEYAKENGIDIEALEKALT